MINRKAKIGIFGEQKAVEYLENKGYEILERNWRYKQDEIDIIAKSGTWLVFAEVKTRTSSEYGKPYEAVDARKEKAMIRAADAYIKEKSIDENIRFDIVSVLVSEDEDVFIEHIEFAINM